MSNKKMSVSESSHNSEINQNYAKNGRDYFFDQAFYQKNGFIAKPDWSGFDDFLDSDLNGFTPKEYAIDVEQEVLEVSRLQSCLEDIILRESLPAYCIRRANELGITLEDYFELICRVDKDCEL